MSRYLSEAEAWREIARRIERRGLVGAGLCAEVNQAATAIWGPREARIIDAGMEAQMRKRLRKHLRRKYLMDQACISGPRILAAYLLAIEAEEEAR